MRSFNWRVIDQIQKAIEDAGLTDAELIRLSGFKRNTFYVKMRGETPLTTDDIVKLVTPLGLTPDVVLERAADALPTIGGRRQDDLKTVELDANRLAATKKQTPIDPGRGEA